MGPGEADDGASIWRRIVVALIADSIEAINPGVLRLLAALGVYQPGLTVSEVDGEPTTTHIFEFTSAIGLPVAGGGASSDGVPVQFVFCLKQQNTQKLSSHRWLFNAFAPHLQPEVCVLLDAGTKAAPQAIGRFWEAFHLDPNLGDCCGELSVMRSGAGRGLTQRLLVGAQDFEYKILNQEDKASESCVGYIQVLLGAFSAYRYEALLGRPLEKYFEGDRSAVHAPGRVSLWRRNMFLAEDRLLAFEVVAKAGARWHATSVAAARAETDAPETAAELILQRRRWLNGGLATLLYMLANFRRLCKTRHHPVRIAFFHFEAACIAISFYLHWFAIGHAYVFLTAILDRVSRSLADPASLMSVSSARGLLDTSRMACWAQTPFLQGGSRFQLTCLARSGLAGWSHRADLLGVGVAAIKAGYTVVFAVQLMGAVCSRPRRELFLYAWTGLFFAAVAVILLAASAVSIRMEMCAVARAVSSGVSWRRARDESGLYSILVAMYGTFGIHIVPALLHLDVSHLGTSLLSYLLLAPSVPGILHIYAAANLSDVSWGTKGADSAPAVTAHLSPSMLTPMLSARPDDTFPTPVTPRMVQVDQSGGTAGPVGEADLSISVVTGRHSSILRVQRNPTSGEDDDRSLRLNILLGWLFRNLALVCTLQAVSTASLTGYLTFAFLLNMTLQSFKIVGIVYYRAAGVARWLRRSLRGGLASPSTSSTSAVNDSGLYTTPLGHSRAKSH